jgi:hypothetical protein
MAFIITFLSILVILEGKIPYTHCPVPCDNW